MASSAAIAVGKVVRALGGGSLHAVDQQLLGGRLPAHGVGLAGLGQGLAGLAGAQQFRGLLQRLADFGAHALGMGNGRRAHRQQGSGGQRGEDSQGFHGARRRHR
jgi:hypothetical protein